MSQLDASELFLAIGEKTRLKIIRLCFEGEQTVDQLLKKTKLEKSLLSKHLKVLRDAEILIAQRDGRQASYTLSPKVCGSLKDKILSLPCCEIKLK